MILDTPTVSFITVLVVVLECGILTALWMIHRDMRGVALWAAGTWMIAVGVLGIYLRGNLPTSVSIIFVNLLIHGGLILTWWGLEDFFDRPLPYRKGIAILCISALGLIYFCFVDDTVRPRVVFLMSISALLAGLRAFSLLRVLHPQTRFSQILAATPLACQGIFNLVLAVAALQLPTDARQFMQTSISGWIFLIPILLSITVVFSVILLLNQTIAAKLRDAARRDGLTDTLNRRAMDEEADKEIARSQRHGKALTLLLLDIDHFKAINDRYGHPAGDAVLRQFSAALKQCLRREDLFARLGGEEFCALLPDTALSGAALLAERVRSTVAGMTIAIDGQSLSLNVSIGIAALGEHGSSWDSLMRQADAALYAAKHAGRNRVVIAS